MTEKAKLVRITTVPISMNIILRGQLGYMNQYFNVIGISGYEEKHFNEIRDREGIRMHAVEMSRNISLLKDIIALWKLFIFFRRERPSIVHTHTPKAGLLGMLASWLAGVPVRMHTVGGIPQMQLKGYKKVLLDGTEKLTYSLAHRVYPNSFGLKKFITESHYAEDSKLKVLNNGSSNGVDTAFFDPDIGLDTEHNKQKIKQEIGLGQDDIIFLFVGRIAQDKGISELITAFENLQKDVRQKVKLVLIGPYEKHYSILDDNIKAAIEKNHDIRYLGRFDDVRPYYLVSDIFILPSYREGFPNAVLEAQSMGLPCIVTNINGCNEIIQDSYNGLIVPLKNDVKLFDAMKKLVVDDEFRLELGSNARKSVLDKYNRIEIWKALLNEYQKFLKEKC